MDYETFKWSLLEEVNRKAGADTTVRLHRLTGENGVRTDTISLIGGEGKASPALAVRPFYESYLKGESLKGLAGGVIENRLQGVGETPGSYGCVPDLDDVRDRLYVRLINGKRNRRLLESIPYVPFLDLAMVFYMRLDVSRRYDAMVLVRRGDLERWRITTEELEKMAVNNTVEQKVCELIPLEAFLEERAEEHSTEMFVLTDTDRRYGAAALDPRGEIRSGAQGLLPQSGKGERRPVVPEGGLIGKPGGGAVQIFEHICYHGSYPRFIQCAYYTEIPSARQSGVPAPKY